MEVATKTTMTMTKARETLMEQTMKVVADGEMQAMIVVANP